MRDAGGTKDSTFVIEVTIVGPGCAESGANPDLSSTRDAPVTKLVQSLVGLTCAAPLHRCTRCDRMLAIAIVPLLLGTPCEWDVYGRYGDVTFGAAGWAEIVGKVHPPPLDLRSVRHVSALVRPCVRRCVRTRATSPRRCGRSSPAREVPRASRMRARAQRSAAPCPSVRCGPQLAREARARPWTRCMLARVLSLARH